jgi:hypothetical protein
VLFPSAGYSTGSTKSTENTSVVAHDVVDDAEVRLVRRRAR